MYVLRASSRGRTFTDFLSRCHDKFGIAEESRSTSIYASFFAGLARAHALPAYKTKFCVTNSQRESG